MVFEHFLLQDAAGRTLGAARYGERIRVGRRELESELTFAREGRARGLVRVFSVEELFLDRASLSWREVGDDSARTLQVEWPASADGFDVVEWGNGERQREHLTSREGALLPHYLLELLRRGRLASGRVPCFDPLARTIDTLEIRTSYLWGAEQDRRARTVELVRLDGTLAARYRFVGTRLVALQWQEGGALGRAVSEAEYQSALVTLAASTGGS